MYRNSGSITRRAARADLSRKAGEVYVSPANLNLH
jgi:hypothetical protein